MSDVSFWPPKPGYGSSAIGILQIGVSPIGDVPIFNWQTTVISQFANSVTLLSMLQSFNDAMDQTINLEMFFDFMWNITTAQGYGLDVWGRIVGVVRQLQVATSTYFGFAQAEPGADNFGPGGTSPFYNGEQVTSNFSLSDDAFRQLILAKAFANICDNSIPSINELLMTLFGGGTKSCYVTDGQNMTMTYTFNFALTPVQEAIIGQSGVLPIPNGTSVSIVVVP